MNFSNLHRKSEIMSHQTIHESLNLNHFFGIIILVEKLCYVIQK